MPRSNNTQHNAQISYHNPQPSWGGNQHPDSVLSHSQQMLNQTPEEIRREKVQEAIRIAKETAEMAKAQGQAVVGIAANTMSSTLPGVGTTNYLVNAGTKASAVLGSLSVPNI